MVNVGHMLPPPTSDENVADTPIILLGVVDDYEVDMDDQVAIYLSDIPECFDLTSIPNSGRAST